MDWLVEKQVLLIKSFLYGRFSQKHLVFELIVLIR